MTEARVPAELLKLSANLRRAVSAKQRWKARYFGFTFHLTRMLEILGLPKANSVPDKTVLNFGCGLNLLDAVNSDLIPLHRFIKGGPIPDVFLSGTMVPASMAGRFDVVICEHVLEHVLPEAGLSILTNLRRMLRPMGEIQISVPSPVRYVSFRDGAVSVDALGLNNTIYNHGHRFMYDVPTLLSLIESAGYRDVVVNDYYSSPHKSFLLADRENESIYVLARNPS